MENKQATLRLLEKAQQAVEQARRNLTGKNEKAAAIELRKIESQLLGANLALIALSK